MTKLERYEKALRMVIKKIDGCPNLWETKYECRKMEKKGIYKNCIECKEQYFLKKVGER